MPSPGIGGILLESEVAVKSYTVVVEREEDGRFSVYVPELPGCASMGETKRQALTNIREAIACYLEGFKKLRRKPPVRRTAVEVVSVDPV